MTENYLHCSNTKNEVNHGVLLVGYGSVTNEQVHYGQCKDYWIVRNSYGKKWGMNGDFWVRRGENDFGIESETTAYDVRLCSPASKDKCIEEKLA